MRSFELRHMLSCMAVYVHKVYTQQLLQQRMRTSQQSAGQQNKQVGAMINSERKSTGARQIGRNFAKRDRRT